MSTGKTKRDHELLTAKQRQSILMLYERDPDEVGVGFVLDRFGGDPWQLTPEAVREIVAQERAKRRSRDRAGVDWAAMWQSARVS